MHTMLRFFLQVAVASLVPAKGSLTRSRVFRPRNEPTPILTPPPPSSSTATTTTTSSNRSRTLSVHPSAPSISTLGSNRSRTLAIHSSAPSPSGNGIVSGNSASPVYFVNHHDATADGHDFGQDVVDSGNGISYVVRTDNGSGKHFITTEQDDKERPKHCAAGSIYPDWSILEKRMSSQKPVFAQPVASQTARNHQKPHYVFISGLPYSGTTALYGLVSTSPEASNLCKGKANCCEGLPLLAPAGMISYLSSLNSEYPKNWSAALGVYKRFWNLSKPILVDKSVSNIDRFPKMWKAVQNEGAHASFIYVVRSVCFYQHLEMWNRTDELRKVVERGNELRAAGARFLVVKYEDMLANPYAVSKDILDFIPELQSLDPLKNGLAGAPYVDGDTRGQGLATYVALKRYFLMQRPFIPIPKEEGKWLEKLGYTKSYFSHAPFAQGYFANGSPLLPPAEAKKSSDSAV